MKTFALLAALGMLGFAYAASAFGLPGQPRRAFLSEPMVCIPGHRIGECDRMRVIRGDSNESEERIARLFRDDRRNDPAPAPQRRHRR